MCGRKKIYATEDVDSQTPEVITAQRDRLSISEQIDLYNGYFISKLPTQECAAIKDKYRFMANYHFNSYYKHSCE